MKTTGYNQNGIVVITFKRTLLVYRRGHAPEITRITPEDRQPPRGYPRNPRGRHHNREVAPRMARNSIVSKRPTRSRSREEYIPVS